MVSYSLCRLCRDAAIDRKRRTGYKRRFVGQQEQGRIAIPGRPDGQRIMPPRFLTSSSVHPHGRLLIRPRNSRSIGVSTGPGQTALTRYFRREPTRQRTRNPTTPFAIEYTGLNIDPCSPDVDAVKRIDPPPRVRISGIAASVVTGIAACSSTAVSKSFISIPSIDFLAQDSRHDPT